MASKDEWVSFIKKIQEMREKRLSKRSELEKAIDILKTRCLAIDYKEHIMNLLKEAKISDPGKMFEELVKLGKLKPIEKDKYEVNVWKTEEKEEEEDMWQV